MNDFVLSASLFLQVAVQMGTPILLGTLGGIMSEKVGNTNLGVEGMMLLGAVFGFLVALSTGNPWLAMLASGLAGALGALIYAVITVTFKGNQVVTGLVLSIFGTGVSSFVGTKLVGASLPEKINETFKITEIPLLKDIPFLGKMLFSQSIYVYISLVLAIILYVFYKKTSFGLNVKSVGENPGAADASGINVDLYKYINICIGGFLCGMGGAFLSLVFVPRWQEGITAGIGWISVALVIFSTWNPMKAIFGAYFFGALRGVGFKLQNASIVLFGSQITIASQILDMIPYAVTIIALILIGVKKKKENLPPQSLGTAYFREDR